MQVGRGASTREQARTESLFLAGSGLRLALLERDRYPCKTGVGHTAINFRSESTALPDSADRKVGFIISLGQQQSTHPKRLPTSAWYGNRGQVTSQLPHASSRRYGPDTLCLK